MENYERKEANMKLADSEGNDHFDELFTHGLRSNE